MSAASGFRLQRLRPEDAERARAHLDALLPSDWREGPPADAAQIARALLHPGLILIVAEAADGAAAGYVSGTTVPKLNGIGDVAFLDDLFVSEQWRGRGLGRDLACAFRAAVLAEARRPVSMWGATATDNAACDRAFRASGGRPDGEIFREYSWPDSGGDET